MAELIKLDRSFCVQCPLCDSQIHYVILQDDLETVDRIECGGYDEHGEPCSYSIKFEDDEDSIEFVFEPPLVSNN